MAPPEDSSGIRNLWTGRGMGSPGFDDFYRSFYGDRWEALLNALESPSRKVIRCCWHSCDGTLKELPSCRPLSPETQGLIQIANDQGKWDHFLMDPASVHVALSVGVAPGDRVLDLCAAPGGKTLILLEQLQGEGSCLANELSSPRRKRLVDLVRKYVPDENRSQIEVRGKDGLRMGLLMPEAFNRVLADVPCSSEKHLVEQGETGQWSEKRSKTLSKKQYGLLTSAALTVEIGGTLVYSTCSISPYENDGVLERFIKRKGKNFRLDPSPKWEEQGAEATEFGAVFLPDRCGYGPMYVSRLLRSE